MRRFITGMPRDRFNPASGPATLSGLFVETDDRTGAATSLHPVRIGGSLLPAGPL
jgi:calcineurin-like phosphoesterase